MCYNSALLFYQEDTIIRRVILSLNEQKKYQIIKKLVETNGNKNRAAIQLGCSRRHINRLICGYNSHGKEFFRHGNNGRRPAHSLSDTQKLLIVDLYSNKYFDSNFTHFCELLAVQEGINVSPSTVRKLLRKECILSPKAHKATKRTVKKELKYLMDQNPSKKKKIALHTSILNLDEAHPRRPRCAYAGEMLQMDASPHNWFADITSHLHIAVDDCTGMITGAWFDQQETLSGYYHVFQQTLTGYGIPAMFFTDNRTVFEYKRNEEVNLEHNTLTQFGYACRQFGVEIRTSSVAQAKGRVERMFNTLQSRLPVELRLSNVTSIQEANEFLISYIQKFNQIFSLPFNHNKSVYEKQPTNNEINLTLAVIRKRVIDHGHCFKYKNQYYIPVNSAGRQIYHRPKTEGTVIEAFDGNLYCCINDVIYGLDIIPKHAVVSKVFDNIKAEEKPRKVYIPNRKHPWRSQEFYLYLREEESKWKKFVSQQSKSIC